MSKKTDIMTALQPMVDSVQKEILIGDKGFEVNIKPFLTPKMRVAIMKRVCDEVRYEDEYNYALIDPAFRSAVVAVCTDLNISMDKGFETALLYKTDLYSEVAGVIGYGVLGAVKDACEQQIAMHVQTDLTVMQMLGTPNPLDRIADVVEEFGHGLRNAITGMDVETAKALLSGSMTETAADNLITGVFGKEDDYGTEDVDEPSDIARPNEVDQPGEHPAEE